MWGIDIPPQIAYNGWQERKLNYMEQTRGSLNLVGGELLDTCEKALQLAIDMIGPIYARRTTRRKNSKITITFDLEPDEDPASTNFTITPDCKVAVPGFILNTMQASIGVQ